MTRKKRLNLDLSPEAYELLSQLEASLGTSKSEVLRIGLALIGIYSKGKSKNQQLAIIDEDENLVKIIVIP